MSDSKMNMNSTDKNNENNTEALLNLIHPQITNVDKGPKFGKRHIQVIFLALVLYMGFMVRTILSVSIVAMTNPLVNPSKDIPTYNWTDKSLIMSSFLWGYCLPQVIAGYVGDRYGAKWFLVGTSFITAVAGLAIPIAAATLGSKGVMVCRFMQGLSQGFLYPSTASLLGKWIPSNERSRVGTFVYSGSPLGIVSSMMLTGYISASSYGWPFSFYLFSGLFLIVIAIYAYVGCSNPNNHSTITKEEKMYIKTNLNIVDNRHELKTPFKEMFSSPAFYALLATHTAFNYTHWTFITETSIYLDKVMKFSLTSNSVLSSIPSILECTVAFSACLIADYLTSRKIVSITFIRRTMNNFGTVVSAIALYMLCTTGPNDSNLVVILILVVGGIQGTGKSGHSVNQMDLAPNFSGLIMGLSNGISALISAFSPILVQFVVTDETNIFQWRIIFYVALGINVIATVVNTFFTSGEKQPWSQGSRKTKVTLEDGKETP